MSFKIMLVAFLLTSSLYTMEGDRDCSDDSTEQDDSIAKEKKTEQKNILELTRIDNDPEELKNKLTVANPQDIQQLALVCLVNTTQLPSIDHFTNLKVIFLSNTRITDLSFLSEKFTHLEELNVMMGRSLRSIEGIEQCPRLKRISFYRNKIKDIKPLEKIITKLKELDINDNPVEGDPLQLLGCITILLNARQEKRSQEKENSIDLIGNWMKIVCNHPWSLDSIEYHKQCIKHLEATRNYTCTFDENDTKTIEYLPEDRIINYRRLDNFKKDHKPLYHLVSLFNLCSASLYSKGFETHKINQLRKAASEFMIKGKENNY